MARYKFYIVLYCIVYILFNKFYFLKVEELTNFIAFCFCNVSEQQNVMRHKPPVW